MEYHKCERGEIFLSDMFRFFIVLLVSLLSVNVVWSQHAIKLSDVPGLFDYQKVDLKPSPLNQNLVRKAIGYPPKAIKEGIEGKVFCRVLVDDKGNYIKHKLTRVDHPLLGKAVDGKVHFLKFSPAFVKRRSVSAWANVVFSFKEKDQHLEFDRVKLVSPLSRKLNNPLKRAAYFQSEGQMALQEENYRAAIRMFSQVIEIGKEHHKKASYKKLSLAAFSARGKVFALQGDSEGAIKDYTEAIGLAQAGLKKQKDIQKQLASLYQTRAYLYLVRGEPYEALEDLRRLQQEDIENPFFIDALLAEVYLELEQWEKAQLKLAETQNGIKNAQEELSSEFQAYFYLLRGILLIEQHTYEEAFASLQESIDLQAANPIAYFYKGLAIWQLDGQQHVCENMQIAIDQGLSGRRLAEAEEILRVTNCHPKYSWNKIQGR